MSASFGYRGFHVAWAPADEEFIVVRILTQQLLGSYKAKEAVIKACDDEVERWVAEENVASRHIADD